MVKKLLAISGIVVMCCSIALAEDQGKKTGSGISEWLKSLQKKIAQIIPKKGAPQTTVVAGVRGAKQDASTRLYWKGKTGDEPVTEEELSEFKKGIDLAAKGERSESLNALQDFMARYPDSALIPDAKKTVDLVKAEGR